ncbi:MAG: hypothetical protein V4689_20890 [Verrucomicrobiota bacterium]
MKLNIIRVSLAFAGSADNTLITFARNVLALLYPQATKFPDIPVPSPVMTAGIEAFANAKAAQPSGGKAATADKKAKREELLVLMRKVAIYVQQASDNDLALLLSTGFEATSNNRAQTPLAKPAVTRIVAGMTGQALVTLTADSNARGYEVRVAEVAEDGTPGAFRLPVFATGSRNISVPDLTPGKLYAYQGRALGGSTTYSDWSDQLVQRAA